MGFFRKAEPPVDQMTVAIKNNRGFLKYAYDFAGGKKGTFIFLDFESFIFAIDHYNCNEIRIVSHTLKWETEKLKDEIENEEKRFDAIKEMLPIREEYKTVKGQLDALVSRRNGLNPPKEGV